MNCTCLVGIFPCPEHGWIAPRDVPKGAPRRRLRKQIAKQRKSLQELRQAIAYQRRQDQIVGKALRTSPQPADREIYNNILEKYGGLE